MFTPYQFEEVERLPNVRRSVDLKWLLESAFDYIDEYEGKSISPPKNTIGYYSHGGWLRQAQGHSDDGLNIPNAEKTLLQHLGEFVKRNPEFTVHVYPHPREKQPEVWDDTMQFYGSFFEEGRFIMAPRDILHHLQTGKKVSHQVPIERV